MDIFARGMKKSFKNRVFYDLMAGPGRINVRGTEYAGSPLLSQTAEFTARIFVESDPDLSSALRQRLAPGSLIIQGDCNDPAVIDRLRQSTPTWNTLGLAFVDNLGMNVTFDTLARLTRGRPVDLMIVVQLQDFTRNVVLAANSEGSNGRFTKFFGSTGWLSVALAAMDSNAQDAEIADRLLSFYQEQLRTIGYLHSKPGIQVMRNSRNATQYRLLLAGKDPKAVELFEKAEAIGPYGSVRLF
jgi:three-Cys-motif partner protein